VAYAVENALFQWEDGARRVREALERIGAVERVLDDLRRRLGSTFTLAELAELDGADADRALAAAERANAGGDAAWVVDAAFHRYAREASDYAGGVRHRPRE
jgi:hypothetical protein